MPTTTPPKPPGQRRRRNLGQSQWRTFAADGRAGAPPPLPKRKPSWSPSTRAWWRRLWASPMAPAYLAAHLGELHRPAELVQRFARGALEPVGEQRQLE